MSDRILELFGEATTASGVDWPVLAKRQYCPYLNGKCDKTRKSRPEVSIGTCSLGAGAERQPLIICPHRFLQRRQIFTDCLQLLTLHAPGNELHVVSEVSVPGGSVDHFLVSVRDMRAIDFVGIEVQALDTTGTVWPARQRFLQEQGVRVLRRDHQSNRSFGINWKMTAKTTLVQLHHKVETFEHVNRRLVLVLQDALLTYLRREFQFDRFHQARTGDAMHVHAYAMTPGITGKLTLVDNLSTGAAGVAEALGLQASARIELVQIARALESKLSESTRLEL